MNSYFDKVYEKATKENIFYAAGIVSLLYIAKSTFGMISSYFANNKKNKEILEILAKEKAKLTADSSQLTKYELSYLFYLKILNSAYKKELVEFNKNRLRIFNADNIYKYIDCVNQYLKNLKFTEQDILAIVFEDLKIDLQSTEIEFNYDKFNIW